MGRKREVLIKVDRKKFKKALQEKNITCVDISRWRNRTDTWLSNYLNKKGAIPVSVADMVEKFGIPRDMYAPERDAVLLQESLNQNPCDNTVSLEDIRLIVREEVRNATTFAVSEGVRLALSKDSVQAKVKKVIKEVLEDVLSDKKMTPEGATKIQENDNTQMSLTQEDGSIWEI